LHTQKCIRVKKNDKKILQKSYPKRAARRGQPIGGVEVNCLQPLRLTCLVRNRPNLPAVERRILVILTKAHLGDEGTDTSIQKSDGTRPKSRSLYLSQGREVDDCVWTRIQSPFTGFEPWGQRTRFAMNFVSFRPEHSRHRCDYLQERLGEALGAKVIFC